MSRKKDNKSEVFLALSMISQIAISMMICMGISMVIGYWLDRWLGTKFFMILMIFVGIGSAMRSLFIITKSFTNEKGLTEKHNPPEKERMDE